MPLRLDDLAEGMWVVVSGVATPDLGDGMFGPRLDPNYCLNGFPWKIIAVSLPFIVCERDGRRISMDTRIYSLVKCSRKYARVFHEVEDVGLSRRRRRKRRLPEGHCPQCGERMRQKLVRDGVWQVICPDCGHDGGRVT